MDWFCFICLRQRIVMFAGSGATFTQWDRSLMKELSFMIVAVLLVLFFDIKGLMID